MKGECEVEIEEIMQLDTFIQDWIPKDASIAIVFDKHYVYYSPGLHDINIKVGQRIEPGSIAERTFTKKCKVEAMVEEPLSNVPYYGIGYPINSNNQLGVIIVILPPSYFLKNKQTHSFLTGKIDDKWRPVPLEQVTYIESQLKKTWFYAEGIGYSSIHTLKTLDGKLPSSFLRIHRSYIVNIQYIHQILRDQTSNFLLTLKDKTILPVSSTYKNHFRTNLEF